VRLHPMIPHSMETSISENNADYIEMAYKFLVFITVYRSP